MDPSSTRTNAGILRWLAELDVPHSPPSTPTRVFFSSPVASNAPTQVDVVPEASNLAPASVPPPASPASPASPRSGAEKDSLRSVDRELRPMFESWAQAGEFYRIVGLEKTASTAQIRRAFVGKISLWHPDKCPREMSREACEMVELFTQLRAMFVAQNVF
eukprot:TRINITY_DN82311_c0_g1_i1.p2 TRINITY_DN82311_c0_g1~~TRINITY_DN82311_c0_g1_i1.p2  ORF type:complete len:175 (+),score=28.58 TRINITY_DN82311_c0_g1_i1:44-526(+)